MRVAISTTLLLLALYVAAGAQIADSIRTADNAARAISQGDASAWSLLRASDDNTIRTLMIDALARAAGSPRLLIDRFLTERDVSVRRAILIALGASEAIAPTPTQRARMIDVLAKTYRDDPDPGIQGASWWTLRTVTGHASPARATRLRNDRGWYVTAEGQTMTVVTGPVSVTMGSPRDEAGREPASDSASEPLHRVMIPRSFAIATTEVTRDQFARFLDANPDAKRAHEYVDAPGRMRDVLARFSPDGDDPAIAVTWYEAAMYCNWLSAREGVPRSDWAYPPGIVADGASLPSDYLHRLGYRLPTESEWEFAARAGTRTSRFFGGLEDRLPEYAWFARHPPRRKEDAVDPSDPQTTQPVAGLRPNDLGLFDVYGNVWEWTQDRVARFQGGDVDDDREDPTLTVWDRDARTRRGGAFSYEAAMERSAARGSVNALPTNRRDNVGFRIARTIPASAKHEGLRRPRSTEGR